MTSWRPSARTREKPGLTELVVSTVLDRRRASDRKADSEEESSEDKEVANDDELLSQATAWERQNAEVLHRVQAVQGFMSGEEGDLSFKKGEVLSVLDSSRRDGWMLAVNALGEKGLIPGNFVLQLVSENMFQTPRSTRSTNDAHLTSTRGHALWAKLRSHVQQTNLADILGAMGALPSGFRESIMAKLYKETCTHHTSTWLIPEPSPTGMAFKDLRFDHKKNQVVPMPTKVTRQFAILGARMIPHPGKGLEVLSRHIRVAVSSKDNILSNIHTVRSVLDTTDRHQKSWKFSDKGDSSLYQRSCVVRFSGTDSNLELVFELGITFKREKTGEVGELSCGWSSLPLFDAAGSPVPHRTYELKVQGGTLFEKGVELDSARNIRGGSRVPSILQVNRTPRLYVQMTSCGQSLQRTLNLLPATVVTSSSYTGVIPCFRQLVTSSFLVARVGLPLLGHVHRPSLNVFLRSVDQTDVMDLLLVRWKEQLKTSRTTKHDLVHQAQLLEKVLLECINPMLHSTSFPAPMWANEERELARLAYTKEASSRNLQDDCQRCVSIAEQVFSLQIPKRLS